MFDNDERNQTKSVKILNAKCDVINNKDFQTKSYENFHRLKIIIYD